MISCLETGERVVDICHIVRLAHSSICSGHENADGIEESAKNTDNIKCQQFETGSVCLHRKTATVLIIMKCAKTIDASLLHFFALEINILYRNVIQYLYTLQVSLSTSSVLI